MIAAAIVFTASDELAPLLLSDPLAEFTYILFGGYWDRTDERMLYLKGVYKAEVDGLEVGFRDGEVVKGELVGLAGADEGKTVGRNDGP